MSSLKGKVAIPRRRRGDTCAARRPEAREVSERATRRREEASDEEMRSGGRRARGRGANKETGDTRR